MSTACCNRYLEICPAWKPHPNTAGCSDTTASLNDTWVLSNATGLGGIATWNQASAAGGPPPVRRGHSAVYNSSSDRMIVFGGDAFGCSGTKYNDLWVLTHASGTGGARTWIKLAVSTKPPARSDHVAIYFQAANRMLVFGGDSSAKKNLTDLWMLAHADGTGGTPQWTKLTATGTAPTATGFMAGTYDPRTNRMTLFAGWNCCSGPSSNQAWILTNADGSGGTPKWLLLTPSGTLPTPRTGPRGIYKQAQSICVYFGGSGTNEVWLLSNANGRGATGWTKLAPFGTPPAGRGGEAQNPAAVYDPASQRWIIFGGKGPAGIFNDTWILAP